MGQPPGVKVSTSRLTPAVRQRRAFPEGCMDAKPDWVRRLMVPAIATGAAVGLLAGALLGLVFLPSGIAPSKRWGGVRDFALMGMFLCGCLVWFVTWLAWLVRQVMGHN
jgi:hypothetical protein